MLKFTLPESEYFNEATNEFITQPGMTLKFEHSLLSLTKWEMHYHKPFLTKEEKSSSETIYYLKCMCLNGDELPIETFNRVARNKKMMQIIADYIANPMTATTFRKDPNEPSNNEIVTNELIYYQMTMLHIPFETEKWHLNRLLTLIRVCAIKQNPPKKMSREEIYARNAALNAERRARLHTTG